MIVKPKTIVKSGNPNATSNRFLSHCDAFNGVDAMLSITPIASNIIRSFAYDICTSLMRLISKPNKIEIDFSQISSWFVIKHYLLLSIRSKEKLHM